MYQWLRKPVNIECVLFSVSAGGSQAGISKRPLEIPEPHQVSKTKEYHYSKCPMKNLPPMDHETYFHYMWDHPPAPQWDRADWLQRLPKKLSTSLTCRSQPGLQWGFGVLIVEGPNKTILAWLAVIILLVSLVIALAYGVQTGDMATGFAVAQWLSGACGTVMAAVYYTATERGRHPYRHREHQHSCGPKQTLDPMHR